MSPRPAGAGPRRPGTAAARAVLPGDPSSAGFGLDRYPFYLLAQIDRRFGHAMAIALKKAGTDRPGWRVLMTLQEQNPSSISDIASRATMKRSTISRVVERMRGAGLVRTAPRAADNRVTDVFIEPAGERTLAALVEVASVEYAKAFAGFSAAEVETLVTLLGRVRANLDAAGAPAATE